MADSTKGIRACVAIPPGYKRRRGGLITKDNLLLAYDGCGTDDDLFDKLNWEAPECEDIGEPCMDYYMVIEVNYE